jgi:hypothetical protein
MPITSSFIANFAPPRGCLVKFQRAGKLVSSGDLVIVGIFHFTQTGPRIFHLFSPRLLLSDLPYLRFFPLLLLFFCFSRFPSVNSSPSSCRSLNLSEYTPGGNLALLLRRSPPVYTPFQLPNAIRDLRSVTAPPTKLFHRCWGGNLNPENSVTAGIVLIFQVHHVEPLLGLFQPVRRASGWTSADLTACYTGLDHHSAKCSPLVLQRRSSLPAGCGHQSGGEHLGDRSHNSP